MKIDAIEALSNAVIGVLVSWGATYWLLPPLFEIAPDAGQAIGMTGMFFALSFARAFVLRALFRRVISKFAE